METSKEGKPNRVYKPGKIVRAALEEGLEYVRDFGRPLESDKECSGDWDEIALGIGAIAAEDVRPV